MMNTENIEETRRYIRVPNSIKSGYIFIDVNKWLSEEHFLRLNKIIKSKKWTN